MVVEVGGTYNYQWASKFTEVSLKIGFPYTTSKSQDKLNNRLKHFFNVM